MGNNYTPPEVEKVGSAIEAQTAEQVNESAVIVGREVKTAADVYKNSIDDFVKFLNGELYAGSLTERRKFQIDFINSIQNFLELDYEQTKEVLDYFLITIGANKDAFDWNKLVAPVASIEGITGAVVLTRYKRFMLFITLLSDYAKVRTQFTNMFDMTKFEAMFSQKARENLHTYVYR